MQATTRFKALTERLLSAIEDGQTLILLPHQAADGDALGSSLGLRLALERLGAKVKLFLDEPFPSTLAFVEGQGDAIVFDEGDLQCEALSFLPVLLDCHHKGRLGRRAVLVQDGAYACVDHHLFQEGGSPIQVIDPLASSTCELCVALVEALEAASGQSLMDQRLSEYLLLGIYTDTGSLQFSCTRQQTYAALAKLMAFGPRLSEICEALFSTCSLETLKAQGLAYSRAVYEQGLASLIFTEADLKQLGVSVEELSGICGQLRSVSGTHLALLILVFASEGRLKCSARASKCVDAAAFMARYGGGGHKAAAGLTLLGLEDPMQRAEALIADAHAFLEEAGACP